MQSTMFPATTATDQELIASALRGDQSGYAQIVERYQERLYTGIRNNVGCPVLAEDIVQDAFVKAFVHLDSFRSNSNFYTWLFRIALNSRRTYFRKNSKTLSLDANGEKVVVTEPRDSPESQMESNEACQEVQNALERLESDHRTILMLREFDELDYETIAQILQVKKGTVRSRLARARSRLRKELSAYALPRTTGTHAARVSTAS